MLTRIIFVALVVCLQSCVLFVPSEQRSIASTQDCQTITKSLELKPIDIGGDGACTDLNNGILLDEECVAGSMLVGVGSFIVSGSIVVANNMIHWAEYRGKCGFTKESNQTSDKSNSKMCLQICDIASGTCSCAS